MSKEKCPIGSLWERNGRTLKVIGKKPFGKIELMDEANSIFLDMPQCRLLGTHARVLQNEEETA